MTSITSAAAEPRDSAAGTVVPWPADDVLILRNRPVRLGTRREHLSRFGDDLWHIQPAHPDAHGVASPIRWQRFPPSLRRAFKTFFFAALDRPFPGQTAGRQRSVGTFHYWAADLAAFAAWLDDHGVTRLSDVTAGRLDAYRAMYLHWTGSRPARPTCWQ